MENMHTKLFLITLLLIFCFTTFSTASIVGLDLGLQHVKAAYLKPGVTRPELLLNDLSKRKTPAYVGFREGERVFGDSAANLATRFPNSMLTMLQRTLGRRSDEDVEQMIKNLNFPFKFASNEDRNGSIEFVVDFDNGQEHYSPEELTGMLLEHIRDQLYAHVGTTIKDFAITVPSFFTVAQRQAVADAAKLADVNLLSLIPEHQAIALQYGISKRKFSKPTHILFVDIGAGSTTSFVASFNSPKDKKSKSLGTISIKSLAWDTTLGGIEFDARIAKHLAQKFKEQYYPSHNENPILSDARGMAKLMKAAKKAKEVLSANKDTVVSVESLYDNKDLSVTFTRDIFEELTADLFDRVRSPVIKAIEDSNIPLANISGVELVGGITRIPKIHSIIKESTERELLNTSLNADEALVVGATYAGAKLSPMFRVKSFTIEDLFPQDIMFQLSPRPGQESKQEKFRTLFPSNTTIPSKKSIVVPRKDDFSVTLVYGNNTDLNDRKSPFLMKVDVTGVKEALESNNTSEAENELIDQKTKIKVVFNIDKNGLLVLDSSRVEFEETFKQSQEVKVKNETQKDEGKPKDETKTLVRRVPLNTTISEHYMTPLNKDSLSKAKEKFEVFRKNEEQKRRAAKALNELESFLYNTRDKLEDDEEYEAVTTEEERDRLLAKIKENSEWLMFENDDTDLNHTKYEVRLRPLEKDVRNITRRIYEMNHRPSAVDSCRKSINMTQTILNENYTAIAPYSTEEERKDVLESCSSVESWLDEQLAKQQKKAVYEDPIVTADEITRRCNEPMTKLRKLSLKPKPKPKPKSNKENNTTSTNDNNYDNNNNNNNTIPTNGTQQHEKDNVIPDQNTEQKQNEEDKDNNDIDNNNNEDKNEDKNDESRKDDDQFHDEL